MCSPSTGNFQYTKMEKPALKTVKAGQKRAGKGKETRIREEIGIVKRKEDKGTGCDVQQVGKEG